MRKILMLLFLVIFGITLVSCGSEENLKNVLYKEYIRVYNNEKLHEETIVEYDLLGNNISETYIQYDEEGSKINIVKYGFSYDIYGNPIEQTASTYDELGNLITTNVMFSGLYQYDEKNMVVRKVITYGSVENASGTYMEYFYTYDQFGNVIEEKVRSFYGDTEIYTKEYNKNNQLIIEKSSNSIEYYDYDSNDNLVLYRFYNIINGVEKLSFSEAYEYNVNGDIIKITHNNGNKTNITDILYIYNLNGTVSSKSYENVIITYEYR